MEFTTEIVPGPDSSKVSKEDAEKSLRGHKLFPKNASVTVSEVSGRWVAAITTPKEISKESAPPPFAEATGGPDAANEDAPEPDAPSGPPESEGGDDTEKKPESEGKEHKDKGGVESQLHTISEMLTSLMTALGLGGMGDSPVPGMDAGPPPPGPPGPAGPAGPEAKSDKQHIVHDRALRPGESQPGTTPIGAPAFASVREDHPWKEAAGVVPSFTVEEDIGTDEPAKAFKELRSLASEIGYNVRQFRADEVNGRRLARATITVH